MKKRTLSLLMTLSLVLSLFVPLIPVTAWAADSGTVGTAEDVPEGYEPPQYERGAINLNGYYTVGSDGKLSQKLEWSFPFENPERPGQGMPDPTRLYSYQLWQSKQSTDGSWTTWATRSTVDIDDTNSTVRVLNIYPDTGNNLKGWMETVDATTGQKIGRGIIQVDEISITNFNVDPEKALRDGSGAYKYDVLMFGTADSNNGRGLSGNAPTAVAEFLRAGGGVLFGHDTVLYQSGFELFGGQEFLDFRGKNDIYIGSTAQSGMINVKVTNTGFLTSRPWDLEGRTLVVPTCHTLGQLVGGADANGTPRNTVWMQFADYGGLVEPNSTEETGNFYLVTRNNTAMIQTGHSGGRATEDEMKVIANTLIYLTQTTSTNETKDISFTDDAAPDKPQGEVTAIAPNAGLTGYSARVTLSGSSDNGTNYAYRVKGLPQNTSSDAEYVAKWSSASEDRQDAFQQTALSGLKGYIVTGVDQSGAAAAKPAVAGSDLIRASNAGDKVTYDTGELVPGKTYYMHAFAVDWSGNVSEDLLLKIDVSARQVNFYRNDGSDEKTSTLLTSEGRPVGFTDSLSRAGYAFGGWYESADGSGEVVTRETVFPLMPEKEAVELYAKWIKTWQVTLGQRGEGTVTAQTAAGQSSPFLVGSDVAVQWQPAPGYHVKGVWLDDRLLTPDDSGQLTIAAIDADHHVLVEFERDAAAEEKVYYRVDTMLIGGGSASSITPSARLAKDSPQTEDYRVSWKVAPGYFVKAVRVDGASRPDLQAKSSVTFDKVASDHRVEIELAKENEAPSAYRVTTELVGGPGSITPSAWVPAGGTYAVKTVLGDSKNYTVRSVTVYDAQGDRVDSFAVDAAAGSVDLTDIGQDYRVVVQLSGKEQTGVVTIPEDELIRVDTSKEGSGSISESKVVKKGEDYTVEWSAQEGWTVLDVTVDGTRTYYPETGTARRVAYRSARSSGSIVIGTPGEYPFEQIQEDHTIHVTFVKAKYEAPAGTFSVQTAITGDCGATITAGNGALDPGSDYPVSWTVPKGYRVVGVLVNGTARDDLLKAGSFTITNIDQNYLVEVALDKDDGTKPEKKEIYTVSTAVYGLTDAAMANMTPTTRDGQYDPHHHRAKRSRSQCALDGAQRSPSGKDRDRRGRECGNGGQLPQHWPGPHGRGVFCRRQRCTAGPAPGIDTNRRRVGDRYCRRYCGRRRQLYSALGTGPRLPPGQCDRGWTGAR